MMRTTLSLLVLAMFVAPCGCGGGSSDSSGSESAGGTSPAGPVQALDVSHWSGTITPEQVAGWISQGYTHLIAGTQKASITQQQLQTALEGGMTVDAYVYLYWDAGVTAQVQNALATVQGAGIGRLWLDAEDDPGSLNASQLEALIQEAIDACGSQPCGIYSGAWWWNAYMDGSTAFSDVPLWFANYDLNPSLDTWAWQKFGGWAAPTGKQYAGNVTVSGVNTDLNTMHVLSGGGGAPPSQPPSAPGGLAPDGGGAVATQSVTLTWGSVGGAEHEVQMDYGDGINWNYYYTWPLGPATSFTVWPQVSGKYYRWRVRAKNAAGWGPWSPYATFYF